MSLPATIMAKNGFSHTYKNKSPNSDLDINHRRAGDFYHFCLEYGKYQRHKYTSMRFLFMRQKTPNIYGANRGNPLTTARRAHLFHSCRKSCSLMWVDQNLSTVRQGDMTRNIERISNL